MGDPTQTVAAQQVTDVYEKIVEDVIGSMASLSHEDGVDGKVLNDLKLLWLEKLSHRGAVARAPAAVGGAAAFYPHNQAVPQHDGALDDAMALAPHPSVGPAVDDVGVGASSAQHPLEATSAVPCAQGVAGVAAAAAASIPQRDGADDEELNSDDDDAEFAAEDEDEEKHTIYCQFEKINRTRNRYKAVLRSVIMNVDGTDYMFDRAQGDWEW